MYDFSPSLSERKKLHLFIKIINSYLAVVAGLCSEADYIFIPEDPAKTDWQRRICEQLKQARESIVVDHPLIRLDFYFLLLNCWQIKIILIKSPLSLYDFPCFKIHAILLFFHQHD